MHRFAGKRVAVVMGGATAAGRDHIMANLIEEHIAGGSTTRTAAAITEDSSVAVSISGRLTARGSMTPAQKAWAEAQAAQRRTGAVDPRRRRG